MKVTSMLSMKYIASIRSLSLTLTRRPKFAMDSFNTSRMGHEPSKLISAVEHHIQTPNIDTIQLQSNLQNNSQDGK